MEVVFGIINYSLLLVFGVLVSVSFAEVENNRKNAVGIFLFIIGELIVQMVFWKHFGIAITSKIYPFITHLPLSLFIALYLKKSYLLSLVSVFVAYLCCQIPNWIGYFAFSMFEYGSSYYVAKSISIIPIFYIIIHYISPSVYKVMAHSKKTLCLFGMLPFLYYLFDYSTSIYTNLLTDNTKIVSEFLPFVVSVFYLVFIMIYHNEIQKKNKIELDNIMLCMQSEQAKNEINSLNEMQKQTLIYRHDMRHHLSVINSYISDGNTQKAREYIKQTQADILTITPSRYCENITVNLILSSFFEKAKKDDIDFSAEVELPKKISISETELCSLFSNGLENAIIAASKVENSNIRTVHINCKIHKSNLLILIENAFTGDVTLKNGIPKTNVDNHGFGVKSIVAITKKYNGYCSFEPKDGIFTLRIVLPL